ncbi:MAG: hypothetical protein IJI34_10615 [Clostridia bacterium]|nr:hypothetical protein [Clostridia bacterium]
MPKQEKQKKRGFRYGMLLKAIAVFLVLEAGVVLLGVFCCNYDRVKADAENTVTVTAEPSRVDCVDRPRAADRIEIIEGWEEYALIWHGSFARQTGLNSRALEKELGKEKVLTLTVKNGAKRDGSWTVHTVVAVKGETTDYLTVEQYNAYHKSNCLVGNILLAIWQVILLGIFIPLWVVLSRV